MYFHRFGSNVSARNGLRSLVQHSHTHVALGYVGVTVAYGTWCEEHLVDVSTGEYTFRYWDVTVCQA